MSSRFASLSIPRWAWAAAVVVVLALGGLLVVTLGGDDEGEGDDRNVAGPGDDVVLDGAGDDPVAEEPADDAVTGSPRDDGIAGESGDDVGPGDDGIAGESGDDEVSGGEAGGEADSAAGDVTESVNPLSIALMVADAGALTPQERSLTGMLEGNGHTVAPFAVTAEPIVNAVNNPSIDLLLFSPSFEFSLLYHPAQPDSLPMLDMTKYSWYRRYMLPWSDDIVGPRFSGVGETSQQVYFEDADAIAWDGQGVGPVQVLTTARFAGEAPMRAALDHSTGGAAQYFLRHVFDTGAESALGVYVPPGSTITEPAPESGGERRFTSVAPWIGLLVFVDDGGDGNQYAELTPAGEALFEAALQHLMNP